MVEILVTISVIAVLAAVVLAGYSAVQNRTFDAAVQADLASNAKIVTERQSDTGLFPLKTDLVNLSTKLGFTTSSYDTSTPINAVYCYSSDRLQMSIVAKSKTGKTYYVTDKMRVPAEYTQTFPDSGSVVCPATGLPSGSIWYWIYDASATGHGGWDSWVK